MTRFGSSRLLAASLSKWRTLSESVSWTPLSATSSSSTDREESQSRSGEAKTRTTLTSRGPLGSSNKHASDLSVPGAETKTQDRRAMSTTSRPSSARAAACSGRPRTTRPLWGISARVSTRAKLSCSRISQRASAWTSKILAKARFTPSTSSALLTRCSKRSILARSAASTPSISSL